MLFVIPYLNHVCLFVIGHMIVSSGHTAAQHRAGMSCQVSDLLLSPGHLFQRPLSLDL